MIAVPSIVGHFHQTLVTVRFDVQELVCMAYPL
jgi:hypothetical protein